MHACWDATLLVLVQPSPASCATCRGTSDVPRVLALTHRHRHKSPSVRQPFAEISGSIAFSPLWFLSRKLCPIFVCQFKGSLHLDVGPRRTRTINVSTKFSIIFRSFSNLGKTKIWIERFPAPNRLPGEIFSKIFPPPAKHL